MLVLACVSCRLDYCNSLFNGMSDGLMNRLQSVQNAAARLVSGARRWPHHAGATPVAVAPSSEAGGLQDSHLAHLPFIVRHGSGLPMATDCQLSSEEGRRQLLSADSRTCCQADLQQLWGPMFHGCRPNLPAGLRQTDIGYEQFKRLLKTYLFGRWDRGALWLLNCASRNFLTCVLTYLVTAVWNGVNDTHSEVEGQKAKSQSTPVDFRKRKVLNASTIDVRVKHTHTLLKITQQTCMKKTELSITG